MRHSPATLLLPLTNLHALPAHVHMPHAAHHTLLQGRLVFASNALTSADDVRGAALAALTRGRKGEFLSDAFTFTPGRDNLQLDYIRQDMSLRAAF